MSRAENPRPPILFDQYSRYRAAADVLEEIFPRPARVVDVGSGAECVLGRLLPDFELTFVDPRLAGHEDERHVAATLGAAALAVRRFDAVVSLDTLEHVAPEERLRFVQRLAGMAETAVVLGAPFADAGPAEATDRRIDEAYRRLRGHGYVWLEEHRRFGLPSLEATREILEQAGWECELVPNAHAPWLTELLPVVLGCLDVPGLRGAAEALSERFNRELQPFDRLEPVYRWLLVGRRPGAPPLRIAAPEARPDATEAQRRWQELVAEVVPTLVRQAEEALEQERLQAISHDASVEQALTAASGALVQGVTLQQDAMARIEHLLAERDGRWKGLELTGEERQELRRLRREVLEGRGRVLELERRLACLQEEGSREARELSQETAALRQELGSIQTSRLWRIAHHYWRLRRAVRRWRQRLRGGPSHAIAPHAGAGRARAAAVVPPPGGPGCYDVVCLPIIDWSFRFQRPQQLCRQLARHGHRVFYVSIRFRPGGTAAVWREIEERVYEVELPTEREINVYQETMPAGSLERCLAALEQLRLETGDQPTVCLTELPFWGSLAFEARKRWGWRVVYDCMDDHSGFATTAAPMLDLEEQLVAAADLVVTSSAKLYESTAAARQRLLLRNATDYEHFHQAWQEASGRSERRQPVIGYYGAIAEWFDTALVARAARERPDWRFVLIGSTFGAEIEELEALPNVELLGERPYAELPRHLAEFDVALIPFRRTPLTLATNPVKFYEYLSAGKPVVAVSLPELEPFRHLYYPVDEPDDLLPALDAAVAENDPARVAARLELARGETWEERYRALDRAIASLYPEVAIVIVSYNNLEYLRLCLDSLRERTVHPRYRVVVVDNASGEPLRDLLRRRAAEDPRLTVILNPENVGFPRANNQGIDAAGDCEYVVLLNDDTVVTRGWLARLLRYLEQDPTVGLVGPVTNTIGNEAQIPVDYEGTDGLEEFAGDRVRHHAGESFEIPVLAMYCVAMRSSLLARIGALDDRFGIGMFEDDDFAKRVRAAGYRVVCAEDVFVHHWGRSSFKRLDPAAYRRVFEENRRLYEEKWGEPWHPHRPRPGEGGGQRRRRINARGHQNQERS